MMQRKKLFIISAYAPSLVNFRGPLLKSFKEKGYDVYASAPDLKGNPTVIQWFSENGMTLVDNQLINTKIGFFSELKAFFLLFLSIRKILPDVILSYGLKPVIYGSLCGYLGRVKKTFSMITGLGHFFMDENINKKSSKAVQFLYKIALKTNHKVFFQNQDDIDLFVEKKLISSDKSILINGSGVDADHFYYCGPSIDPVRFTFIGRLIKQKGIMEFFQAAKLVKKEHPNVIFTIVGGTYPNPSALSEEEFNQITQDPDIEYLGELKDVREILKKTSVFVLPSYREGASRAILEAMSMGLPIITTDVPGCRQLVENGVNGFLIHPRDCEELKIIIINTIVNAALFLTQGKESRKIIEEKYAINNVNEKILSKLK